MANKNSEKRMEKLRAKITDYDLKIQMLLDLKQRDVKELERLEAEMFISCCKSKNISLSEAFESLELYQELKTKKEDTKPDYSKTDSTSFAKEEKINV